jgi:hypothetical protein
MSLSNPKISQNPAEMFIQWSGSDNQFSYYDKEKQQDVVLECPLYFIRLDELTAIKGWSDKLGGMWSNEIRKHDEILIVKTKNGVFISGKWSEIKEKIENAGGKYTKSIYAALIIPNDKKSVPTLKLVNFQINGSGFGKLFDCKINDDGAVIKVENNGKQQKKGSVSYFSPIYTKMMKRSDILNLAKNLDKQLQEYLDAYFTKTIDKLTVEKPTLEEESDIFGAPVDCDMPF